MDKCNCYFIKSKSIYIANCRYKMCGTEVDVLSCNKCTRTLYTVETFKQIDEFEKELRKYKVGVSFKRNRKSLWEVFVGIFKIEC